MALFSSRIETPLLLRVSILTIFIRLLRIGAEPCGGRCWELFVRELESVRPGVGEMFSPALGGSDIS